MGGSQPDGQVRGGLQHRNGASPRPLHPNDATTAQAKLVVRLNVALEKAARAVRAVRGWIPPVFHVLSGAETGERGRGPARR